VIKEHVEWFAGLARSFLEGEAVHDGHVELKLEHSLNVLGEARAVTASLGLTPRLERLAHLAALCHDAGRFPQYRRYRTFRDSISEDHAMLGARSLRAWNALGGLERRDRALVLGAVVLHNRKSVPERIPPELALLTRIVRDCDKLDIVRIMLDHLRPGGKRSDVVTLHLADEPDRYTPEIAAQIRQRRIGDYARMRYENDFKLLLLSWVFDLNFKASRRAFLARGHADELFALLPRSAELTSLADGIYGALNG
jgi:hypothetical protein